MNSHLLSPMRTPLKTISPSQPTASTNVQNFNSHLLQLPIEIIWKIFQHACERIPGDERWQRNFYPLHFGSVCKSWREIAWSNSELWDTLVIRISHASIETQAKLLEEWFERAKGRPLDVYVGILDNENVDVIIQWFFEKFQRPTAILNAIGYHSSQWRNVELHVPNLWHSSLNLDGELHTLLPLPLLQSITFDQLLPIRPELENAILDLSDAPLLHDMTIIHWQAHQPKVIHNNITRLTISHSRHFNIQVFADYPCLVEVYLVNVISRTLPEAFTRTLVHPKIEKLDITLGDESSLKDLLRSLILQNLRTLSVTVSGQFSPYILQGFLHKSSCTLTEISLNYEISHMKKLTSLLTVLSTLEVVRIHDESRMRTTSAESQIFWDALLLNTNPTYLPQLRFLSFEGYITAEPACFLKPLLARLYAGACETNTSPTTREFQKAVALKSAILTSDQSIQWHQDHTFRLDESDETYAHMMAKALDEGRLVLRNRDQSHWV